LEPEGITLATVLAIELAIFATTPFLDLLFALGFAFDALLVFDFGLVVAAFFAIADSPMRYPFQITLNYKFWGLRFYRVRFQLPTSDFDPDSPQPNRRRGVS
jgi:hypothetical protein